MSDFEETLRQLVKKWDEYIAVGRPFDTTDYLNGVEEGHWKAAEELREILDTQFGGNK